MLLILRNKKKTGPRIKKFLQMISVELDQRKVEYSSASFEEVELFLGREKIEVLIDDKPLSTWDTIYPRKVGRNRGLAHILAQLAKKQGIYFIDRYHERTKDSSDVAKMIQMFRLAAEGVSIPRTYFAGAYSKKHLRNAASYLKFPIVVKECNTSQGAGVFLVKNSNELEKVINDRLAREDKKEIFLQEFIANDFEYRILVTGNKVAVTEKKIRSPKEEFRNNVHLGAREEFVDTNSVGSRIKKEALLAAKITDIQVAGVDVVERADGQPVIFEVNSCPSFTLDKRVSNEVEKIAEYLTECEKK